ncbi:hypothetical protein [Modestobacter sp. SYSU DS0290]
MSRTGSGGAARVEELREPLGVPTLLLWRRIGPAAGAGAVLCVLTGLAVLVTRDEAGAAVGLLLPRA